MCTGAIAFGPEGSANRLRAFIREQSTGPANTQGESVGVAYLRQELCARLIPESSVKCWRRLAFVTPTMMSGCVLRRCCRGSLHMRWASDRALSWQLVPPGGDWPGDVTILRR